MQIKDAIRSVLGAEDVFGGLELCVRVCVSNHSGDHLWENVWHCASGGQQKGWRERERRETGLASVYVSVGGGGWQTKSDKRQNKSR